MHAHDDGREAATHLRASMRGMQEGGRGRREERQGGEESGYLTPQRGRPERGATHVSSGSGVGHGVGGGVGAARASRQAGENGTAVTTATAEAVAVAAATASPAPAGPRSYCCRSH